MFSSVKKDAFFSYLFYFYSIRATGLIHNQNSGSSFAILCICEQNENIVVMVNTNIIHYQRAISRNWAGQMCLRLHFDCISYGAYKETDAFEEQLYVSFVFGDDVDE